MLRQKRAGAGDNGISVAAMLESIRVLHARPTLRNTILFLFTDGEELGWKGAYAYLSKHPEAKSEVGMLLVFDARPGNAPLNLIKTSPGDAWLLRQMAGLQLLGVCIPEEWGGAGMDYVSLGLACEELEYVDTHLRTVADRADRAFGGFSSGGFCAFDQVLRLGQVGKVSRDHPAAPAHPGDLFGCFSGVLG